MKLFLIFTLSIQFAYAKVNILNFNTMCDYCKGSDSANFPKRIKAIQDLIKIYKPDLISLQEVRTAGQIESIIKPFSKYKYVATDLWFFSYADPTIIYNQNKYLLIEKKQFWLGPVKPGSFSMGWKFALPRQLISVLLEDISTKRRFYFLSSHFDNRIENLNGAAGFVNKYIRSLTLPVIFAADTNMTVDMPEYKKLLGTNLENAFDLKKELSIVGKYQEEKELCYHAKGSKFPECRVDHFLISKGSPWNVERFLIDTLKTEGGKFPSDHRPVIIQLSDKI
jgi:endonuclease/exonuclease/phosphatase family metal-dependent hydrolase